MKRFILAAVIALSLAPAARAAEVQITFDDKSQQAAFQLPALLDQCVAGITLRADATVCKTVSAALNGLAAMVSAAQKAAADAEAQADAKAAADKAAADKAAAAKPADKPDTPKP